jgi:hypothetical protein
MAPWVTSISSAHACFAPMSYTAVAYITLGCHSHGVPFGPEFATADDAWRWLHGLGDTPCSSPPHEYIEVELSAPA